MNGAKKLQTKNMKNYNNEHYIVLYYILTIANKNKGIKKMDYICKYNSLIGEIVIKSDGEYITNLYIEGQSGFEEISNSHRENGKIEILQKAISWLDTYFEGKEPKENLKLKLEGTGFQKEVWNILLKIPYGKTITYGDIAEEIAKNRGIKKMSSQACGGAVGSNPISIIVPCHRVVGKNGNLVGYGGGLKLKTNLLRLEGIDLNEFYTISENKKIPARKL